MFSQMDHPHIQDSQAFFWLVLFLWGVIAVGVFNSTLFKLFLFYNRDVRVKTAPDQTPTSRKGWNYVCLTDFL